jgi:hypothetical protein
MNQPSESTAPALDPSVVSSSSDATNSPLQALQALDPGKLKTWLDDWRALFGVMFADVMAIAVAVGVPRPAAQVTAGIVIAALTVLAIVILLRKRPKKQTRLVESVAFKGPHRYLNSEILPGQTRRALAQQLFDKVCSSTSNICVVTGESGAGKSSLIDCALTRRLRQDGYRVIYVERYPPLFEDVDSDPVHQVWQEIIGEKSSSKVLLILDQFEELLDNLPEVASRKALGECLRDVLESDWKVVIGIRKESYIDLREIQAALRGWMTLDDTFYVRNFGREEAALIIEECAARADIACPRDLCNMIAADLTLMNREVRPTDLQVVCAALRDPMTVDRYQEEGRATGLRAAYLAERLQLAGEPRLTKQVLRELCDIPNNKKRANPVSVEEIVKAVRVAGFGEASEDVVTDILGRLKELDIVTVAYGRARSHWSLVHDYFVEPIKLATENSENRRESLLAELEYFKLQVDRSRWFTIPVKKVRELKRNLPAELLTDRTTRRLIRRSLVLGHGQPVVLYLSLSLISVASVVLLTADWDVWHSEGEPSEKLIRIDDPDNTLIARRTRGSPGARFIVSIPEHGAEMPPAFSVWDAQTAKEVRNHQSVVSAVAVPVLAAFGDYLSADLFLWSYNSVKREVQRWSGESTPDWAEVMPPESYPGGEFSLDRVQPEDPSRGVVFRKEGCNNDDKDKGCVGIYFPKTKQWKVVPNRDLFPQGGAFSELRPLDGLFSENFRAWISGGYAQDAVNKRLTMNTRVTIWRGDLEHTVCGQNFEGYLTAIGMLETSKGVHVVLADPQQEKLHVLRYQGGGNGCRLVSSDWPKPLQTMSTSFLFGGPADIMVSGQGFLLRQDEPTRTVIWSIDVDKGKFVEPIVAGGPAPRNVKGALVWNPQGRDAVAVWVHGQDQPFYLNGLQLAATDLIAFDRSFRFMLQTAADGHGRLWNVANRGTQFREIPTVGSNEGFTSFNFSFDENAVIGRKRGGQLFGWSLPDGDSLGYLGGVGSEVIWSSYDARCGQIFVWTREGQVLDWRRGANFAIFGFIGGETCSRPVENGAQVRHARLGNRSSPTALSRLDVSAESQRH